MAAPSRPRSRSRSRRWSPPEEEHFAGAMAAKVLVGAPQPQVFGKSADENLRVRGGGPLEIRVPQLRPVASSTDKSGSGRASVDPLVWGYVINPVALAAFILLRHWSLVADEPIWAYLVVLWGGALASTATELWFRRRPSTATLYARIV